MKRNVVGVLHMVMALEYGVPKIKTCLLAFKHVLILGMSCSYHVLLYKCHLFNIFILKLLFN